MTTVPTRNPAGECVGASKCNYHASGGTDSWCSVAISTKAREFVAFEDALAERVATKMTAAADEIDRAIKAELRHVPVMAAAFVLDSKRVRPRFTPTSKPAGTISPAFVPLMVPDPPFADLESRELVRVADRALDLVRSLAAEWCVVMPGVGCSSSTCAPCRARRALT